MSDMNLSSDKIKRLVAPKVALLLAFIATSLFASISCQWAFVLTTPSDPLQYVAPALRPEEGFPYIDRIVLWLWIRVVAMLPLPAEMVGGISTLIVSSATLFIVSWWLAVRVQPLAGAIFSVLYIASPMVLGISTYTFPMQPMTLVLVTTVILMDLFPGRYRYLIGGAGGGIASLCKVQGISFLGYLAFEILINCKARRVRHMIASLLGFILALVIVFALVIAVDNVDQLMAIFKKYLLTNYGKEQFQGRHTGGIPPFYAYLVEPTCIAALAGMVWPWLDQSLKRLRPFAAAATVQSMSLILIYAVTQRGGPIIYNYSLDALVLALVAFSGSVALIFNDIPKITNSSKTLAGLLLLMGAFLTIEVSAYCSQAAQYWPAHSFYTEIVKIIHAVDSGGSYYPGVTAILDLLAAVATWGSLYLYVLSPRLNSTLICKQSGLIAGFVLLLLGVGLRAGAGVNEGKFKKNWSTPYHKICRRIERLSPYATWVSLQVNRASLADGSSRVEKIYDAFYSKLESGMHTGGGVTFGGNEPASFRFLVTDQIDLIKKHSRKQIEDRLGLMRSGQFFALVDQADDSVVVFAFEAASK
jgi:hypothetical protein